MKRVLPSLFGLMFLFVSPAWSAGPANNGRPLIPSEFSLQVLRQEEARRVGENRQRLFESELACRRQENGCPPPFTIEGRPDPSKSLDDVLVPSEPARHPAEGLR